MFNRWSTAVERRLDPPGRVATDPFGTLILILYSGGRSIRPRPRLGVGGTGSLAVSSQRPAAELHRLLMVA
jgi:hypothetical protein